MRKNKPDPSFKIKPSRFNDNLPLFRYYGKTRREHIVLEWITMIIQKAVILLEIFIIFIIPPALTITAFYMYSKLYLIYLLTAISLSLFVIFQLMKKPLRYSIFYRKLKNLCKKSKHRLTKERETVLPVSLTLETHKTVYFIHTVHIPSSRYKVCFDTSTQLRVIRPPSHNIFLTALDIRKRAKEKILKFVFSPVGSYSKKFVAKAIVILPSCDKMYSKAPNGSMLPTVTGCEHFGYSVFTARQFINFIKRMEI